MSALYELQIALNAMLGSDFYFDAAPREAAYPYRVGSFSPSFDDEVAEVFYLELDYWDTGKTTERIYSMAEADAGNGDTAAPTGLNRAKIQLESGYAVLCKDKTVPLTDEDAKKRRVRISYTVRLYYE